MSQSGVYGTQGVANASNIPGARYQSISWIDSSGNFWLFGGYGKASVGSSNRLNDLWKFDGTNWTWVSGDSVAYQYGIYGTKGVADASNKPGARRQSISWIDSSDNLWLFGGSGLDGYGSRGELNDLWKFDGANWTWVSGDKQRNRNGFYGTKGVANASNKPGARSQSISWTDSSGNFWLFGGYGYDYIGFPGLRNDLWKFDGAEWTWISGVNTGGHYGIHGTIGETGAANHPGARSGCISWVDSNDSFWLFGGVGLSFSYLNDLWKYDGINWTWVSGVSGMNPSGIYGTKGVAGADNMPGARSGSISWIDSSNVLWLFGGYGIDSGGGFSYLNDLWKFDGVNWTWVSGSDIINQSGAYGTKGVANTSNIPGARQQSISWIDSIGNFWLFGGSGKDNSGSNGWLNDLWKFDGVNWTWVSGSDIVNQSGVYGTKGIASAGNIPGVRDNSISWVDLSGNLWLFGGFGVNSGGSQNCMNDVWKFDGAEWTWVGGSEVINQAGVYGAAGVADAGNIPGARYSSISWVDSIGDVWLFGGSGYDSTGSYGSLNDFWKFDGVNWTWFSGSKTADPLAVYGTMGISYAVLSTPGPRSGSISWIDSSDDLWLFGGYGYDSTGSIGAMSDLWKFEPICDRQIFGDVNNDCRYDLIDFAISASEWLEETSWHH